MKEKYIKYKTKYLNLLIDGGTIGKSKGQSKGKSKDQSKGKDKGQAEYQPKGKAKGQSKGQANSIAKSPVDANVPQNIIELINKLTADERLKIGMELLTIKYNIDTLRKEIISPLNKSKNDENSISVPKSNLEKIQDTSMDFIPNNEYGIKIQENKQTIFYKKIEDNTYETLGTFVSRERDREYNATYFFSIVENINIENLKIYKKK